MNLTLKIKKELSKIMGATQSTVMQNMQSKMTILEITVKKDLL